MNINGLSNEQVIENRKKYGSNVFSKKKKDSFLKLLLETFSDPIIKILLIALGIKTIFLIRDFDWYETIGIQKKTYEERKIAGVCCRSGGGALVRIGRGG